MNDSTPAPDSVPDEEPELAPESAPAPRSRAARWLLALLQGLSLALLFLAATVGSVALHSNVKVTRQAAAELGSWLLKDTFYGQFRFNAPTRLSLDRLELPSASVLDEHGEMLITLKHVRIELGLWANLTRWLSGEKKLTFALPHARIEQSHVRLVSDPVSGEPTLVRALTPKPRPVRAGRPPSESSEVRVFFPVLELGTITAESSALKDLAPTLSNIQSQLLVTGKGVALDIQRVGANIKGLLGSDLVGTGTMKLRAPGKTQARFAGFLGDLEVQLGATLDGSFLELDARSQAGTPEALSKLLGAWPFRETMSVEVEAKGELPKLSTRARASTETSSIELNGDVLLAPKLQAAWDVTFKDLDAQSFSASAPSTRLSGNAVLEAQLAGGAEAELHATLKGQTLATTIGETPVPAIDFALSYDPQGLEGALTLHEPNMPFDANVRVNPSGNIDASVHVPPFALEKSRLPRGPRGLVALDGTVKLAQQELSATLDGRVDRLTFKELSVEHVDFVARGSGRLADLDAATFEVTAQSRGLRYGKLSYGSMSLNAHSSRQQIRANAQFKDADGRQLRATATVYTDGTVRDLSLHANRHGVEIKAKVERVIPSIPEIEMSSLSVRDGKASLDGKVRYRPGLLEGELAAKDVDLARLAAAFGLPSSFARGTLDSASVFTIGPDVSRATLHVQLANAAIQSWGRVRLSLDATLRGEELKGSVTGRDDTTQVLVSSNFEVALAGHALEAESYEKATGSAELSLSNLRLAGLNWLLDSKQIADVDGLVGLRARLQRSGTSGWPSALVEVGAQDLKARVKVADEPRSIDQVSSYVSAMFDANAKRVFGSGMVADASGTLLTLTAALALDPDPWLADAKAALLKFQDEPLNVVASLPRRNLDHLPLVRSSDVPLGAVEGQFTFFGTPRAPQISALVDLHDIAPRDGKTRPISFKLQAQYAPDHGQLDASVQGTADGRPVIMGKVKGQVPFTAMMGLARWNAELRLGIDRFPLALIPQLSAAEVGGTLTGTVDLSQKESASLSAHLDVADLSAGQAPLGNGTVRLKGSPGEAVLSFVLADQHRTLDLKALALGQDPTQLPLPHQIKSLGIALHAKHANAAALAPLLRNVVARLRGDLDANLTWFIEREAGSAEQNWDGRLEGEAKLSSGGAYIEALGLELHDVVADLKARPAGMRSLIELSRLEAKARTTQVNFEGSGQVYLEGNKVIAGDAKVLLRSVPITLQGLSLGKASGRASCVFERAHGWDVPGPHEGKDYLLANVDLDHWNMKAARNASRQLIELRENPEIIVLQSSTKQKVNADLTPYRILITLKEDVRFGVGDISLPLEGDVKVDYDGESRVSGVLRLLPGSRLPILGKRFDVLSGSIVLDPKNLGNPALDLALSGTTPEGTLVPLTIAGTLHEPVLEPPPSELQALLGGSTATLLGGGVQALGVNELLGDSVGAVELRVDAGAEEEDDPSYAAAVQIGPDLWFEGGYQRAQDSGLNQNQGDVFQGSVDYRFHRNWSLKTRLGNAGGGVDVLWQHRY